MRKQGLTEMAEPEAEFGSVKVHTVLFAPYPVAGIPGQMWGQDEHWQQRSSLSVAFIAPFS